MSVSIRLVAGSDLDQEIESRAGSYRIAESGVLQLISKRGQNWAIEAEYSPAAWMRANGTLWKGNPKNLIGLDGFEGGSTGEMLS